MLCYFIHAPPSRSNLISRILQSCSFQSIWNQFSMCVICKASIRCGPSISQIEMQMKFLYDYRQLLINMTRTTSIHTNWISVVWPISTFNCVFIRNKLALWPNYLINTIQLIKWNFTTESACPKISEIKRLNSSGQGKRKYKSDCHTNDTNSIAITKSQLILA